MGGEYLPSLGQDSVEIVRIVFASIAQDVISIRATRTRTRILYCVQDEYESEFRQRCLSSTLPLSLNELIRLIDTTQHSDPIGRGGLVWSHILWHVREGFLNEARDLISVASEFYAELGNYYDRVIGEYIDAKENSGKTGIKGQRISRASYQNLTLDLCEDEPDARNPRNKR